MAGLLAGALLVPAGTTWATDIVPIFIAGNPSCTDLGYSYGFKIDPPNAGTYSIDGINTVTVTTDGVSFDWSSTLGMDAVISKGGPTANLYVYDPPAESTSDTDLHSPINPNNGKPYGLSHMDFCFDYEVKVSKDAHTSFTRTWQWRIDKSVSPAQWLLADGQQGTSMYTVAVERTGYTDSDWTVEGAVRVYNPAPMDATILSVSDVVSAGIPAAVDCGVAFPYALGAGQTLECSYHAALPDGSARTNVATAATTGPVGGGSGSAAVVFGAPTVEVNASIHVVDTNGGAWPFAGSGSVSYGRTFVCGADAGMHDNTATIVETGQSASASVSVQCPSNGCTLTPGYWKTHSGRGPAPYDDTWKLLGAAQENTAFFLSGKTYYQALWQAPQGNAYYILAHAWIATTLNGLNGASMPPEVMQGWQEATTLFQAWTPAQIGAQKGSQQPRKRFLELAGLLDMYNNGLLGPGHCSE
jgi:hypothetical protein